MKRQTLLMLRATAVVALLLPPTLAFSLRWRQRIFPRCRTSSSVLRVARLSQPVKPYSTDPPDESLHSAVLAGQSPKVVRLRQKLRDVWSRPERYPILLVGPTGSGKNELLAEVTEHLPATQREQIYQFSLDEAMHYTRTILGTDKHAGLLDLLADNAHATLVLRDFQSLHVRSAEEFARRQQLVDNLQSLLTDQSFFSAHQQKPVRFQPRIVLTMRELPEYLEENANVFIVKVPAVQTRLQDLQSMAEQEIEMYQNEYGLNNVMLSKEAVHRLLDHTWDDCVKELDEEVRRSLEFLAVETRADPSVPKILDSRHMFVNSPQESLRLRLLYEFPILRKIIQSPWVFDHTLRYVVLPAFLVTLGALILGPQTRDHNTALTYFWAGWWPLVMLSFPFLGRIWCSICPFMATSNLVQEIVTQAGVKLQKWPKWHEKYGSLFAFALFFAILMWEELWNLPQNGTLSAYLLLLITSGAVFNSVQFEKRAWCRYLCPIGAMCRVFGTVSMLEVRSWKGNCEGCRSPLCTKGMSPAVSPSDTFALKGCTMDLKNNKLRDMGDCTLCMACIKNCEREVPELNARPVGLDYGIPWLLPTFMQRAENVALSQVETNYWLGALLTILQGSVLVHYMPIVLTDLAIDPTLAFAAPSFSWLFLQHFVVTAVLLGLPGVLSLAVDKAAVPLERLTASLASEWEKRKDSTEQLMIIDIYQKIMSSDQPIKHVLREFDPDHDGAITCWECKQALSHIGMEENQCETLMKYMKRRFGNVESIEIEVWLDYLQELYTNARAAQSHSSTDLIPRLQRLGNEIKSKKTFVEIFNEMDKDHDGFVSENELSAMFLDENFLQTKMTEAETHELFVENDRDGNKRLNLFEFMGMMRKIVRVGIQEIGYGYLPLAWASLTAYWLGVGLKELGLTLERLPDTLYLDTTGMMTLPSWSASHPVVQIVQAAVVLGALPISLGLTQKLCDDNKIGPVRLGLHAAIQVLLAAETLHLMLSPLSELLA